MNSLGGGLSVENAAYEPALNPAVLSNCGEKSRILPQKFLSISFEGWNRDNFLTYERNIHAVHSIDSMYGCQAKNMDMPEAVRKLIKLKGLTREAFARDQRVTLSAVEAWVSKMGTARYRRPSPLQLEKFASMCDGELSNYFLRESGATRIIQVPIRAETQLSPTSKEFNHAGLHAALDAVLKLPEAMRELVIPQLVRVARDFAHWNPEAASQEDEGELLKFPDIVVRTTDEWKEGTEDRLGMMNQVAVLVDPLAAGEGLFVRDNIDSFVEIPQRFTPKGPEAYVGLKVNGRSMSPLIDHGSIVVCERKEVDWSAARDKLVVVKLEGATRVKRVARESTKERIIFRSENEEFKDIIVAKPPISPMVRRVVFWWSFAK